MAVDGADAADEPVGRRALDQLLERAAAALRGDDERRVLDEAAVVDEVGDVLARGALPGRAPARDRVGPAVVEPDVVALDDLGEIGAHAIEVDRGAATASPRRGADARRRRARSASPGMTVSPTAIGIAGDRRRPTRPRRRAPSSSTRARRAAARAHDVALARRRSTRRSPAWGPAQPASRLSSPWASRACPPVETRPANGRICTRDASARLDQADCTATHRSRSRAHGLGLLHRSGVPEEARLGRGVLPGGGRAARLRLPVRGPLAGPEDQGAGQGPAGPGQGPGPVGDLPRRGARRPRLRPAQARPAQRDPRPLPVGAADVRRRRARHREHGDARGLRHRGAEGALARADAQPGDVVGVLDDRAAGRLRPEPVQDPRRHATATSGSSTARSGSRAPGGSPTSSS